MLQFHNHHVLASMLAMPELHEDHVIKYEWVTSGLQFDDPMSEEEFLYQQHLDAESDPAYIQWCKEERYEPTF